MLNDLESDQELIYYFSPYNAVNHLHPLTLYQDQSFHDHAVDFDFEVDYSLVLVVEEVDLKNNIN